MTVLFITLLKRPPPLDKEEEFLLHSGLNPSTVPGALSMHGCPDPFIEEVQRLLLPMNHPVGGRKHTYRFSRKDGAVLSFHAIDITHYPTDGTDDDT